LAQHAIYLIRPDTHVGLAERSGEINAVRRYFEQRRFRIEAEGDKSGSRASSRSAAIPQKCNLELHFCEFKSSLKHII